MKNNVLVLLIFCLFSLNSMAQEDTKKMIPPEGKSLIYFVRPSKLGFVISFVTLCDDMKAGVTKGKRFIYKMVEPGKHNILTTGGEKDASLELTTEAGKTYFIELIPKMGVIAARVKMEVLSEADGREKLDKCKSMEEKD